jgi:hypothetical protein
MSAHDDSTANRCTPSPRLARLLDDLAGSCEQVLLQVTRQARTFTYAVYLAVRAG